MVEALKDITFIALAVILLGIGNIGFTQDGSDEEDAHLLGSYSPALLKGPKENGITIELVLTLESMKNLSGGVTKDAAFLSNLDITIELDTKKADLWGNGIFFMYLLGNSNAGKLPAEIIGDIQATSNIEAPETLKLYELWYEHSFPDKKISVLFGLHDYNSEFDTMEYGGVFQNSSFGITPQISQVGPSIFPTTALGFRFKSQLNSGSYLLAALYDGVPGDPDNEESSAVFFNPGDGVFYALEAGLTPEEDAAQRYYKLAVGGWYHTAEIQDFSGTDKNSNGGFYLIGEYNAFQENGTDQGMGVFGQIGTAFKDRSEISFVIVGGINYKGLFPGRDEDVFGFAVAHAVISKDFLASPAGAGLPKAETAIEIVYQMPVNPWLTIKPDIQYIINPASMPGLDNAWQAGIRMEVIF